MIRTLLSYFATAVVLAAGVQAGVSLLPGATVPAGAHAAERSASLPGFQLGTMHSVPAHAWVAYYDGHRDTYVNTDVSNKAQAGALGINYAPVLAHSLAASSPMYFVHGRAAAGQIAVFGSEPGESDYSPLWREFWVSWKAGITPVLLVRDDQINSLVKAGKLSERITNFVLNAPVISVGR